MTSEQKHAEKVEALIRYVVQECDDYERFGFTKLNKVLWWADREHLRRYGSTISGAQYVRTDRGPVMDGFYGLIDALKSRGLVAETTPHVYTFIERRLVSLADERIELTGFDHSEIAMVRAAIAYHRDLSAKTSSERSHDDLGWQLVEDGAIIPDSYAELTLEPLTEDDLEAIRRKPPLTADDFARFREELRSM